MNGVPVTKPVAVGHEQRPQGDSRADRQLAQRRLLRAAERRRTAASASRPSSSGRARLGEHRVAVVMPTLTWQAYNLRDVDGDGKGDSWYAQLGPQDRRSSAGRS